MAQVLGGTARGLFGLEAGALKPPEVMTLRWAGLETTATVAGDGPLVLLLHGFPDHRETWRHQIPALATAGFRVVAPNLRPRAASQPASDDYSVASLAGDVLAWMDLLGAARARVVGHDWGAAVAWALAALAPDRVERVAGLAVPPLRRIARMAAGDPTPALFRCGTWPSFSSAASPSARCSPATAPSSACFGAAGRPSTRPPRPTCWLLYRHPRPPRRRSRNRRLPPRPSPTPPPRAPASPGAC